MSPALLRISPAMRTSKLETQTTNRSCGRAGVRSPQSAVRSRQRQSAVGSRKSEVGSRQSAVRRGSRQSAVGSGSPQSAVGSGSSQSAAAAGSGFDFERDYGREGPPVRNAVAGRGSGPRRAGSASCRHFFLNAPVFRHGLWDLYCTGSFDQARPATQARASSPRHRRVMSASQPRHVRVMSRRLGVRAIGCSGNPTRKAQRGDVARA